jgi:hypothetical protein
MIREQKTAQVEAELRRLCSKKMHPICIRWYLHHVDMFISFSNFKEQSLPWSDDR